MILAFIGMILFAWAAEDTATGKRRSGKLGVIAVEFASVPTAMAALWSGNAGQLIVKVNSADKGGWWKPTGASADNGVVLLSHFDWSRRSYVADLIAVGTGQVLRRYAPERPIGVNPNRLRRWLADFDLENAGVSTRLLHPFLTEDGGLIYQQNGSPLAAIDACGRTKWILAGAFHHSIEAGADGALWVPMTLHPATRKTVSPGFAEDAIAQVAQDGKLLGTISLETIFAKAGLGYLVDQRPYSDEPYHLNDIEPVLSDGPYWKRGDLFLSIRNLSMVMLYRPATNTVLWWRQGPWQKQHDVNILNDHQISIFDNHARSASPADTVDGTNQLLVHDFSTDKTNAWSTQAFELNHIATPFQGRGQILANGDAFIEETNLGRLMRVGQDGSVKWRYISATADGDRLMLAWSRYFNTESPAIAAAKGAKCVTG